MKKLAAFFLLSVLLVACGGEGEEGKTVKIDTKDIKGSIKADPDGTTMLSHSGDIKSEGKVLKFDEKGEISVFLTKKSIDDYKSDISDSPMFDKVELVDEGDEHLLYYTEKSGFKDKEEKGYKFFVIKKYGDDTYVCLEGQGVEMFSPIEKEDVAKELLEIAKTFEKE